MWQSARHISHAFLGLPGSNWRWDWLNLLECQNATATKQLEACLHQICKQVPCSVMNRNTLVILFFSLFFFPDPNPNAEGRQQSGAEYCRKSTGRRFRHLLQPEKRAPEKQSRRWWCEKWQKKLIALDLCVFLTQRSNDALQLLLLYAFFWVKFFFRYVKATCDFQILY